MKYKYIIGILSLSLVIAIICVGGIARKTLSKYNQASVPVNSENYILNEEKNKIGYLSYLQKYIRTSGAKLSVGNEKKKDYLVQELMVVTKLENKNDIKQMSIDGMEIAIGLIKNIYKLYEINIIFTIDGNVNSVEDKVGNSIYQNIDEGIKTEFSVIHATIVACTILMFLVINILITKKIIIIKGEDCDGLNEKEYA